MLNSVLARHDARMREQESLRLLVERLTMGDLLWFLFFNLLLFQVYFQEEIGGLFTYLDECSALLILAITTGILIVRRHEVREHPQGIVVPLVCLVCALLCGLASNLTSGVVVSPTAIAIDLFTFCKFPIVVFCCVVLSSRNGHRGSLWRLLVLEARILIVIMAFCAFMTFLFGSRVVHMTYDIRYGHTSFKFIFYHPEVVNLFTLGLIAILLIDRPDGHRVLVMLGLMVMCSTLRAKAMAFAALALVVIMTSKNGRISLLAIICGVACAIFVAGDQFSSYYENGESARSALTTGGTMIASRFAPLGSGFATYGSAVTAGVTNYSPLYFQLGFNNIWGLSPYYSMFISDTFWPVIMAQLGYAGAALYTAAIALALLQVYQRYMACGRGVVVILLCSYLAICTTATSAVFAPQWTYLMSVLYLGIRHLGAQGIEWSQYDAAAYGQASSGMPVYKRMRGANAR